MQFISESSRKTSVCFLLKVSFPKKTNNNKKTKEKRIKVKKCKYDKTSVQPRCHVWVLMHQCREQHTDVFTLTNNMQEHKYKDLCLLIKLQSWKWISSASFVSVSICGDDRHRKPFSSLLPSCWSRVRVKDSVRANASVSLLCRKSKAQLLPAGDERSQSAVHQDFGLQHHPDHQRSAGLSPSAGRRHQIRASVSVSFSCFW